MLSEFPKPVLQSPCSSPIQQQPLTSGEGREGEGKGRSMHPSWSSSPPPHTPPTYAAGRQEAGFQRSPARFLQGNSMEEQAGNWKLLLLPLPFCLSWSFSVKKKNLWNDPTGHGVCFFLNLFQENSVFGNKVKYTELECQNLYCYNILISTLFLLM